MKERREVAARLQALQTCYDLDTIIDVTTLTGGEWKTLLRIDTAAASYVASISHPTTPVESLAYEHRLLRYLHARLPQVPAPLVAQDGSTYFVEQGRIVCLLPLMPGVMAEGDQIHLAAARFLAQFQRVGMGYPDPAPRPGVPAWHTWDWHAATWPTMEAMLLAAANETTNSALGQRLWRACGEWTPQIVARRAQIIEERAYFQQWIHDLAHSGRSLTMGLLHDDYHGNNLLAAGETITALLDWDSCHPDWLVWDLSNALWEFCHDDDTHALVVKDTQAFLATYAAAGGPVPVQEYDLIIPLIRCRRMIEVLGSLQGIATGGAWDESPDYLVHNLLALEKLRSVTIEFDLNRILVILPITDPRKVEDLALQLTLRYLGDAAQVQAEADDAPFNQGGWKVGVYRTDGELPVGYLFFSSEGEFLPEFSTRFDRMRAA
ncbi:MAG: phosphotransferase [Caldilineaceae bacterium]